MLAKKKCISLILIVVVLLNALPIPAFATESVISGRCGENLSWALIEGELIISGSGEMYDYGYAGSPWWSYLESITSITITEGVSSIGEYSFCGCSNLVEIAIPTSITRIGKSAFSRCSSLTSISLPDGLNQIENETFYACRSLATVTIPKGVANIGDSAFCDCSNLTTVDVPEGVSGIGAYAFYYCSSLTAVTIPDSVISIGDCAFAGCSKISDITIPDGVTGIGQRTFGSCSSLIAVTIPQGVTVIGDSAFAHCGKLKKIVFEGDAPFMAENCFSRTTATAFYPPNNATWTEAVMLDYGGTITWAPTCLHPSTKLINVNEATCIISGYTGDTVCVDCGETLETGTEIPVIDHSCEIGICVNCGQEIGIAGESLRWVFDKVTGTLTISGQGKMDDYIYENHAPWNTVGDEIVRAIIESGVTSISDYAFSSCTGLTGIYFCGDAPDISSNAFWNVAATAYYPVGNDTWTMGDMLGYGGVLTWKSYADVIASGNWSENISWVLDWKGTMTFSGSGDMKSAPGWTWYDYRNSVQSIVIEYGITSVGRSVFSGHNSLKKVVIPDSVTKLGEYAFQQCPLLESVKLSNNLTSISSGAFFDCKSLGCLTIPDGVTVIGQSAFYGCTSLIEIELPDSVVSIESNAFSGCSNLKKLDIPGGIEDISDYAFNSCKRMSAVVFLGSAPAFSVQAFYNLRSTVYYPIENSTWAEDTLLQYGGEVTWVSYEGEYPDVEESGNEETISGTCGENLTWTLDSDGTLTISGSGSMTDYGWYYNTQSPWHDDININSLVVEEGVADISDYAFAGCRNMT